MNFKLFADDTSIFFTITDPIYSSQKQKTNSRDNLVM